jgi:hypothetical protein
MNDAAFRALLSPEELAEYEDGVALNAAAPEGAAKYLPAVMLEDGTLLAADGRRFKAPVRETVALEYPDPTTMVITVGLEGEEQQ